MVDAPRFLAASEPFPRRWVGSLIAAWGLVFSALGVARYVTFHNETFDLAFYNRIAWGIAHQDFWEPMVDAHFYGLHLSFVLVPLAPLTWFTDAAPVMIVLQAFALAGSAWPLAKIGAARFGASGALAAAVAWLFYPNIAHVAGYEFHPGSLAVFPLAWLAYGIDQKSPRAFALGTIGALLCREDLALVTMCAAALYAFAHADQRRAAAIAGGGSLVYLAFFLFVLHPHYAPANGSLQLHFPTAGESGGVVAAVASFVTEPGYWVDHFSDLRRVLYLPKLLAPLAFLPLLRARWLLPTLPVLGINLLSAWPTTTDLDVHYLTPALPFLVVGALHGADRAMRSTPLLGWWCVALPAVAGHLIAGGTPLSADFDAAAFRPDPHRAGATELVARVGPDASVQAPYPFLPHFAQRRVLHRASRPEGNDDFYVLDVSHRRRFAGNEDLIRTSEEPNVRDWLARDDHAVVASAGDYLLLERGADPRAGLGARAIEGRADPGSGQRIAACLRVRSAELGDALTAGVGNASGEVGDRVLRLRFVATGECPSDLVIRLGIGRRPSRVDLLADGWLSPAHFRSGDAIVSEHRASAELVAAIREHGLRVGALRQSGARPEHADPVAVDVAVFYPSPSGLNSTP